jgi:hypothetical protein
VALAFPRSKFSPPKSVKLTIASPYRLFQFGKAAYDNTRAHLRDTHTHFSMGTLRTSLFDGNLFRRMAFPTRLPGALALIDLSLDSLCRHEIEMKLSRLRKLRELQAAGLGLLVSEGMDFAGHLEWKEGVVKGVDMMKSTMEWLQNIDVQTESIDLVDQGAPHLVSTNNRSYEITINSSC